MCKKILCIFMSLLMIIAFTPQGTLVSNAASDDVTYLAFCSDIHNQSGNASTNRMKNWIDNVTDKIGSSFDRFGSCGDMGPASGTSDNFFKNAQLVMDVVEKDRASDFEDGGFYVCGNHEYRPGQYTHDKNSTTKKYSDAGEYVVDDDGYIMYSFGSRQWDEIIQDTDIEALDEFLNEHGDYSKPIFILTHFPLHRWSSKSGNSETSDIHDGYPAVGSKKLINVLNNAAESYGQNIILLWGHNHSSSAEFYDDVYTESINETPIDFTYASAGAMADSEYGRSASVKGKGLVAAVEDNDVTLTYYTESGSVVGSPVTVHGKEVEEEEPEVIPYDPVVEPDEPDNPQGPEVTESENVFLAFGSDIHNQSGNASANRMKNWIDNVTDEIDSSFDRFGSCGDMGPASGTSDNYFKNAQVVMDVVEKDRATDFEDGGFYVCGNHEYNPGQYTHDKNSTTKKYSDAGEYVVDDDGYIMYSFGSRQWDEIIQDTDIEALDEFLNEHGDYNKPIFILTHFPLHRWSSKSGNSETSGIHDGYPAVGSKKLIKTLNRAAVTNGQNIILLWGHNHSSSAELYDDVYTESINETPIYFTYASAGAMADSEYGQSANVKGKGLVAEINDTEATLTYYTEAGKVVGTPVTVGDAEKGEYIEEPDPIAVTPVSNNAPTVDCELDAGESVLVDVTNGSSRSTYTFNSTSSDESVVKVTENSSVSISAGKTAQIKIEAVSAGSAKITIQNNGSWSVRKAYLNITVKDNTEKVNAAKEAAKNEVAEAAGSEYSDAVKAILNEVIKSIESAKSISAVEIAKKDAVDKIKAQIKKEEEEAIAAVLKKFKEEAEAELYEYAGESVSEAVEGVLDNWVDKIEKASDEGEVSSLLSSAKKAIDVQKLQDIRDGAMDVLDIIAGENRSADMNVLLDGFEKEISEAVNETEIAEIVEKAKTDIAAQKIKDEEAAALKSAKEAAKAEIISLAGEDQSAELKAIVAEWTSKIENAESVEAVQAILEEAKAPIDAQKKIDAEKKAYEAALKSAKDAANEELTSLAGNNPDADMNEILNAALAGVEEAATLEAVESSLEAGRKAISEQVQLEKEYIFVTPTTSNPTVSRDIYAGDTITISVTNGSSNSYTYTTSSGNASVVQIIDNASVSIGGGKTVNVKLKGVKQGTAAITVSNGNSWFERKATINVTVKEDPAKVAAAKEAAVSKIEAVTTDEVKDLADGYLAELEKADTVAEVEALESEAVNAIKDQILQNVKDRAAAEVEALVEGEMTSGMKNVIEGLVAEINDADDAEGVGAVLNSARAKVEAQKVKDEEEAALKAFQKLKDQAKGELSETAGVRQSKAMESLLEELYAEIQEADTEEAVQNIVTEGMQLIEAQKEIDAQIVVLEVTPTTSNPTVSGEMVLGESLQLEIINGSANSSYTFVSSSSNSGVVKIVENASVSIAAGGSQYVTVEAVKSGTANITITNNNSWYARKATVSIKVIEDPALTKAKEEAESELLSVAGQSEAGKTTANEYISEIRNASSESDIERLLSEGITAVESAKKAEAEKVSITVTPAINGPTYNAVIPAGGNLEITVKGGYTWGTSNYAISSADTGIAKINGSTSIYVGTNGSGMLKVQGVKSGSTVITISDGSWWSPKSARINLTVQ